MEERSWMENYIDCTMDPEEIISHITDLEECGVRYWPQRISMVGDEKGNLVVTTIKPFMGRWIGKGGVHAKHLTNMLCGHGKLVLKEVSHMVDRWQTNVPSEFPVAEYEELFSNPVVLHDWSRFAEHNTYFCYPNLTQPKLDLGLAKLQKEVRQWEAEWKEEQKKIRFQNDQNCILGAPHPLRVLTEMRRFCLDWHHSEKDLVTPERVCQFFVLYENVKDDLDKMGNFILLNGKFYFRCRSKEFFEFVSDTIKASGVKTDKARWVGYVKLEV